MELSQLFLGTIFKADNIGVTRFNDVTGLEMKLDDKFFFFRRGIHFYLASLRCFYYVKEVS